MPKDKAAMMRRLRKTRKDAGLVPYGGWCTPEQKEEIDEILTSKRMFQAQEEGQPDASYFPPKK